MTITLNLVEILVVVVVNFILGFLWFSPMLFGRSWQREVGLSDAEIGDGPGVEFALVALGSVITAIVMATLFTYLTPLTLTDSLIWGVMLGIGFTGAALMGNSVFERRSKLLLAIDAGYWILTAVVTAAIVFLIK